MRCRKCGTPLFEAAVVCCNCGTRQVGDGMPLAGNAAGGALAAGDASAAVVDLPVRPTAALPWLQRVLAERQRQLEADIDRLRAEAQQWQAVADRERATIGSRLAVTSGVPAAGSVAGGTAPGGAAGGQLPTSDAADETSGAIAALPGSSDRLPADRPTATGDVGPVVVAGDPDASLVGADAP